MNSERILIIAAHPDDETLGLGGTILKYRKNNMFSVLFLAEGVSARFAQKDKDSHESIKQKNVRNNACMKALKFLNIKDYEFQSRYCAQFDTYPLIDIVKSIEAKIDKFKPTIIFTHNPYECNVDHSITYKAVSVATRSKYKDFLKKIYTFEIPCSGNLTFEKKFEPNTYIDISSCMADKIKLCKIYKKELRKFPFPRSIVGIETLARFRGMQSGLNYAESFHLERDIDDSL